MANARSRQLTVSTLFLLTSLRATSVYSTAESTLFVRLGNTIQIPCAATLMSEASLPVRWLKKSQPIQYTAGRVDVINASLQIWNANFADSGEYTCSIGNGSDHHIHLTVMDVPMRPAQPEVKVVDAYSIKVSWNKTTVTSNETGPIIHYTVLIKNVSVFPWEDAVAVSVGGAVTGPVAVSGLLPYRRYTVSVTATNAVGTSQRSVPSLRKRTLEAAPTAKPQVATSSKSYTTAIILHLLAPPAAGINGHLIGYKLEYSVLGGDIERKNLSPTTTVYNISGLRPFTRYAIQLAVYNVKDHGPWSKLVAATEEGVPSRPPILYIPNRSSSMLQVAWEQPEHINGVLLGYHLKWGTVSRDTPLRFFTINHLRPYTEYMIQVAGFTQQGMGDFSDVHRGLTDVSGPSAPQDVAVTVNSSHSLLVTWTRPLTVYRQIDEYNITYRRNDSDAQLDYRVSFVDQGKPRLNIHSTMIRGLTCGAVYEVQVAGVTFSVFSKESYIGDYSKRHVVALLDGCGPVAVDPRPNVASILGAVFGLIALAILIAMAFVLSKRYMRRKYKSVKRTEMDLKKTSVALNLLPYAVNDQTSIPIDKWSEHITKMRADSNLGFAQQFEEFGELTAGTAWVKGRHSTEPDNESKNRYINIIAYDHSRVVLRRLLGKSQHSDYINANFVDAFNKKHAYIAAQGPLNTTCGDFWRMIWEQRSSVIMMITNLVEHGRRKCYQYWPDDGDHTYGAYNVRLLSRDVMAYYTVRVFALSHAKGSMVKRRSTQERLVYQYHFTEWPDHGVPHYTLPVLSFVTKATAANTEWSGPIVIHCSAGVGRTGTCIVIDSMLQQMRDSNSLDVYSFLAHIRKQRNYLVQTEDQYVFIHSVLLERIESDVTEVTASDLSSYLSQLELRGNRDVSLLEKQHKLINCFEPNKYQLASCLADVNQSKNRSQTLVPVELSRVHLLAKPGETGSDYINASYMPGFNRDNEFIVSQHPIASTVDDFWRMVWDQNSRIVVLLSDCEEQNFPQFWPTNEEATMNGGHFTVAFTKESQQSDHKIKDFILQSTQDDYECTAQIVQCASWLDNLSPISRVFELVKAVRRRQQPDEGPVIVIDRYGGRTAAKFCALATLHDQLQREHAVDVYMVAKMYHMKRPTIFSSIEDVHFLYKAVASIVDEKVLRPIAPGVSLHKGKGSLHSDTRLYTVYESSA